VVEGPGLIAEASRAGWQVESLYLAAGEDPAVLGVAADAVHVLGPGVLQRVASTDNPQPAIAVVAARATTAGLLDSATRVVVTDRLADPGNLGTIMRSAEAAGFDAVVVTPGSVDPFNPKVVRASAGALFHVPVVSATLDEVGDRGLTLVATSSHQGASYVAYSWPERTALVVGNEARGLDDDTAVDAWVRIDHAGRAESLNVAMATTLLCFESVRAR
jgi:TrmH family RNA methyltransferase